MKENTQHTEDNISLGNQNYSFNDKLRAFLNTAVRSNLPLAIWRIPKQNEVQGICQLNKANVIPEEIETAPSGFYFSPFDQSDHATKHFIRSDIHLKSSDNDVKINPSFSKAELIDDFEKQFQSQLNSNDVDYSSFLRNFKPKERKKEQFINLVEESIHAIADGKYQKIVPARNKSKPLSKEFNPIKEFFKLCEAYENAFVSIVFVPTAGLWMGATPELLLSLEDNKIFKTEALAGTQSIDHNFELSKAAWTQKEIEEQALVSRYIINCFKSIRLREFEEYGPKTVKAGNLIHLKTEYSVNMEEVSYPLLGTAMLDLLHPTSAVCGMPMKPAAKFLKQKEGFDREYFSGYLGPVNIDDNTRLFVNLRCMRILKNKAILYAGAGVTEDSDPESEWMETEMKFRTLLNIIQ